MKHRTRWMGMGAAASVAVLGGVLIAGCGGNNAADNTAATTTATNTVTTTTTDDNMVADGDFKAASATWGKIEMARGELTKTIEQTKLKQVHEAAFKVRDLVRQLSAQSGALDEDKKKQLEDHIKTVDQLAGMLDEAGDSNNLKSTHEHHMALEKTLGMIQKIYPEGKMQDPMKMDGMDHSGGSGSGGGMADDNMGDKPMPMGDKPMGGNKPMPSKGMSGGNKSSGAGSNSGSGGMSGGGMSDDPPMSGGSGGGGMSDM